MYTAFATSGGVFIFAIVAFVLFVISFRKIIFGKDIIGENNIGKENNGIFVVCLYNVLCVFSTVAGQCITWFSKVYIGVSSEEDAWTYGYKAFTYLRYSGSYMPVLFMFGFLILCIHKNLTFKISLWIVAVMSVLSLFWWKLVYPYMLSSPKSLLFITNTILPKGKPVKEENWYFTIGLMLVIALVWMILLNFDSKRKVIIICTLVILYTSAERIVAFNNIETYNQSKNMRICDKGTKVLQVVQEYAEDDPLDVYVIDVREVTDHQIWYMYQVMNYKIHVVPGYPSEYEEDVLIFSNGVLPDSEVEGMKEIRLDSNEYLYVRGKKYNKILRKCKMIKRKKVKKRRRIK